MIGSGFRYKRSHAQTLFYKTLRPTSNSATRIAAGPAKERSLPASKRCHTYESRESRAHRVGELRVPGKDAKAAVALIIRPNAAVSSLFF
jgi:hypothetical protein